YVFPVWHPKQTSGACLDVSVRCRKSLRAAALHDGAGARVLARPTRGAVFESYERDCAASANARGGESGGAAITRRASAASSARASNGRLWHLLWKSACFSMCVGSAYWGHLSAKSFVIPTNGLIRSESRR